MEIPGNARISLCAYFSILPIRVKSVYRKPRYYLLLLFEQLSKQKLYLTILMLAKEQNTNLSLFLNPARLMLSDYAVYNRTQ